MAMCDTMVAAKLKAKQLLECAWRLDGASPTLVAPSNDLFELKEQCPKELTEIVGDVQITETSNQRSSKVSASFGIEGSYGTFSGAADMSMAHHSAATTKTIRVDNDLFAIKYVCQNNVLDCSKFLLDDVVSFVKKSSAEEICKKLGHFYATEVSLGGHMQLTRIIQARSEDTTDSLSASINASYGNDLIGSIKAKASGSSESSSKMDGREEKCYLSVQGGRFTDWLQFDGTLESRSTCQTAWAAGMEGDDSSLYPLKMRLSPIWEAFSEHPDLKAKAAELQEYLLFYWKIDKSWGILAPFNGPIPDSRRAQIMKEHREKGATPAAYN